MLKKSLGQKQEELLGVSTEIQEADIEGLRYELKSVEVKVNQDNRELSGVWGNLTKFWRQKE